MRTFAAQAVTVVPTLRIVCQYPLLVRENKNMMKNDLGKKILLKKLGSRGINIVKAGVSPSSKNRPLPANTDAHQ